VLTRILRPLLYVLHAHTRSTNTTRLDRASGGQVAIKVIDLEEMCVCAELALVLRLVLC
jgi:hypothetical protein